MAAVSPCSSRSLLRRSPSLALPLPRGFSRGLHDATPNPARIRRDSSRTAARLPHLAHPTNRAERATDASGSVLPAERSFPIGLSSSFFGRMRPALGGVKYVGFRGSRFGWNPVRVYASASEDDGKEFDYDLFTIGAGSGGVRGSRFSTQYGATAAICELPFSTIASDSTGGVGGTCVLRGCVPKKLLVYGSHFHHDFESSKGFGWEFPEAPVHDWPTLIKNKNKELFRLTNAYRNTLANAKVELIEGRGKILDPHTVEVNSKKYTAKHILISTGGRPYVPDIPGKEYVITSDEALDLPNRPEKIVIVGSGYIALEFACIFKNLGSEVHLIYRQSLPLRGFDEEIRRKMFDHLGNLGIILHAEEKPSSVERLSDSKLLFSSEKGTKLEVDTVMFATGRSPNTKNLGLENVGVQLDASGAIIVDEYSRTNVPSIWAVGDVTNRINLTPVALMEGMAFAKTAFLNIPTKPDYKNVPCAVFTQPPVSVVGLTEEEAVQEYGDVDIYTSNFRPMKATLSGLSDRTFMKLVVDPSSDKVIGAHMFGDDAPEIIQGIAIAIKAGCTKADFDSTVGIHPSSAEEFVTMRTASRKLRKEKSEDSKQVLSTTA